LHNTGIAGAADGAESIDVIQRTVGIQLGIGYLIIPRRTAEINSAIDATELSVIGEVEGVCPQLNIEMLLDGEKLR
jgi:hypothetical protein